MATIRTRRHANDGRRVTSSRRDSLRQCCDIATLSNGLRTIRRDGVERAPRRDRFDNWCQFGQCRATTQTAVSVACGLGVSCGPIRPDRRLGDLHRTNGRLPCGRIGRLPPVAAGADWVPCAMPCADPSPHKARLPFEPVGPALPGDRRVGLPRPVRGGEATLGRTTSAKVANAGVAANFFGTGIAGTSRGAQIAWFAFVR